MSTNRGEFVAGVLAARAVSGGGVVASSCRLLNATGEPLPAPEVQRLYLCDLMLRPFPVAPEAALGEVRFQRPDQPFRIGVRMAVPSFGNVYVYADNRGRGYSPSSFGKPLLLNYEFAAGRITAVRNVVDECKRSGPAVSPEPPRRLEQAAALLQKAEAAGTTETAAARLCFDSSGNFGDRLRNLGTPVRPAALFQRFVRGDCVACPRNRIPQPLPRRFGRDQGNLAMLVCRRMGEKPC